MPEHAERTPDELGAAIAPGGGVRARPAGILRALDQRPLRRGSPELRAVHHPPPRRGPPRWLTVTVAVAAALVLIATAIARFVEEPLRRRMERDLNAALDGYTVRIGALAFHPFGFSLDLQDSTIVQQANPEPPVAYIPRLHTSVHWRALLHGGLVADFLFEHPVLKVDLRQVRHEANDTVRLKDRGWQEAAEKIYPLKINLLRVVDGDITYADRGPFAPLHATQINLRAENIRNVRAREREYPSDVHLDAVLFGTGTLRADGHADFLAAPYAGIDVLFHLEQLPLHPFAPLVSRYASIRGGVLSTAGELEYSPRIGRVDLKNLTIDGVQADVIRTAENGAEEARGTEHAAQAVEAVSNAPTVRLRAEQIRIRHGALGFVSRAADPAYRLFVSDADLTLEHFSNQRAEGPSFAQLRGRFMGSGDMVVRVRFRPETKAPNFDLDLRIEHTELRALNDLLRAQGNFDVVDGEFSLYSVLRVRDLTVDGYVKPIFKGVQVYEARQDGDKPLLQRLHERMVDAAVTFLKSWQRHEVATKADLSGPLIAPRTSRWQIIGHLLENALIKPITPGLDESALGDGSATSPRDLQAPTRR